MNPQSRARIAFIQQIGNGELKGKAKGRLDDSRGRSQSGPECPIREPSPAQAPARAASKLGGSVVVRPSFPVLLASAPESLTRQRRDMKLGSSLQGYFRVDFRVNLTETLREPDGKTLEFKREQRRRPGGVRAHGRGLTRTSGGFTMLRPVRGSGVPEPCRGRTEVRGCLLVTVGGLLLLDHFPDNWIQAVPIRRLGQGGHHRRGRIQGVPDPGNRRSDRIRGEALLARAVIGRLRRWNDGACLPSVA